MDEDKPPKVNWGDVFKAVIHAIEWKKITVTALSTIAVGGGVVAPFFLELLDAKNELRAELANEDNSLRVCVATKNDLRKENDALRAEMGDHAPHYPPPINDGEWRLDDSTHALLMVRDTHAKIKTITTFPSLASCQLARDKLAVIHTEGRVDCAN